MSKTKSITELVTDLQKENESLKRLEKIANQYTRMEFGYTVKELHTIIAKQAAYERRMKEREASNHQPSQPLRIQHSES